MEGLGVSGLWAKGVWPWDVLVLLGMCLQAASTIGGSPGNGAGSHWLCDFAGECILSQKVFSLCYSGTPDAGPTVLLVLVPLTWGMLSLELMELSQQGNHSFI